MLDQLEVSPVTLPQADLDKLFEGVPEEVQENITPQHSSQKIQKEESLFKNNKSSSLNVPFVDFDELDGLGSDNSAEGVEEEKDAKAVQKQDEGEEVKKEEELAPGLNEEDIKALNAVLKNSTNFLVEKGIFKDFDGREELEMDSDTFAELFEKQVEAKVADLYNDKKTSTGEYGQAIIEHIEKGGDPDEIIDLFKEIKQVEQMDFTEDVDSQKALISKWYKEQYGWSDAKVSKYISGLQSESDEALEGEAEEVKSKYEEHYQKQLQDIKLRQDEHQREQEKLKVQFEQNITKAIEGRPVDEKTKQLLKNSVLKFKKTQDGRAINDLYLRFAEIQSTPELYAEFVEWAMDKEGYLKRQLTPIKNEIATKTFNFVKGNTAVSKNKGSGYQESPKSERSNLDFSSLFKK